MQAWSVVRYVCIVACSRVARAVASVTSANCSVQFAYMCQQRTMIKAKARPEAGLAARPPRGSVANRAAPPSAAPPDSAAPPAMVTSHVDKALEGNRMCHVLFVLSLLELLAVHRSLTYNALSLL